MQRERVGAAALLRGGVVGKRALKCVPTAGRATPLTLG